jgi:hypothetical protein
VVDLEHGTVEVVPVLHHPALNRQHVIEKRANLVLPEGEHRLEVVGVEADINTRLGKFHARSTPSAAHILTARMEQASSPERSEGIHP